MHGHKPPGVLDSDLQANKVRKNVMSQYRLAGLAGDGIGKEVMPEGLAVLDAVARKYGVSFDCDHKHMKSNFKLFAKRIFEYNFLFH